MSHKDLLGNVAGTLSTSAAISWTSINPPNIRVSNGIEKNLHTKRKNIGIKSYVLFILLCMCICTYAYIMTSPCKNELEKRLDRSPYQDIFISGWEVIMILV